MFQLSGYQVRATYDPSDVAKLFVPGGDVWKAHSDLRAAHFVRARAAAPSRTGELKRSVYSNMTPNSLYECQYTVGADTPYAWYVINGTTGPIHSDDYGASNRWMKQLLPNGASMNSFHKRKYSTHGFLAIRPSPHSWYPTRWVRDEVSGQSANNFLNDTFDAAHRVWKASQRAELKRFNAAT